MMLGALQKKSMQAGLAAIQGDPQGFVDLGKLAAFLVGSGVLMAAWWWVLFGQQPAAATPAEEE